MWHENMVLVFEPTIDSNDNGVDDGALVKWMNESHDSAPANLDNNSKTRLPNSQRAWKIVMLDWNSNSKCLSLWILWIKNSSIGRTKRSDNTKLWSSSWCKVVGFILQEKNWLRWICQVLCRGSRNEILAEGVYLLHPLRTKWVKERA